MTTKPLNKWKEYLLRSSLPLEQIVQEVLENHNFNIMGEFTYKRPNEHNIMTEFSVDNLATYEFNKETDPLVTLNILTECKYNHPGIRWVFSPLAPSYDLEGSDCLNILDNLCAYRFTTSTYMNDLFDRVPYCTKGVEIHDGGIDPNAITRGLYQLRYAIPNLIIHNCSWQLEAIHEVDLFISIVCPILVTTAQLFVLKPKLNIEDYHNATNIIEIADEVPFLVVSQEINLNLQDYVKDILTDFYQQKPLLHKRLGEIDTALNLPPVKSAIWEFNYRFAMSPKNTIVVQLNEFDSLLGQITHAIQNNLPFMEKRLSLLTDLEKREAHFVPL